MYKRLLMPTQSAPATRFTMGDNDVVPPAPAALHLSANREGMVAAESNAHIVL